MPSAMCSRRRWTAIRDGDCLETVAAVRWQRAVPAWAPFGEAQRLGLLVRRHDLWCVDSLPAGSPRLFELVGERLRALDDPARDALGLIAMGEPLALDVLEELVDREILEQLESADLIVVGGSAADPVARSAHPLFGDVMRSRIPELRRRRLMADARRCPRTSRRELHVTTSSASPCDASTATAEPRRELLLKDEPIRPGSRSTGRPPNASPDRGLAGTTVLGDCARSTPTSCSGEGCVRRA